MKTALITGITGQDGSYLTELLLKKGYEVHGVIRRSSSFNTGRIDHIYQDPHEDGARLILHYGDLADAVQMVKLPYELQPDDCVIATNETHSVREFCQETFARLGLDWEQYVMHDSRYERPAEVDLLIGNPAKAHKQLGWEPKVRFKELVKIMVDADLKLAEHEARVKSL